MRLLFSTEQSNFISLMWKEYIYMYLRGKYLFEVEIDFLALEKKLFENSLPNSLEMCERIL